MIEHKSWKDGRFHVIRFVDNIDPDKKEFGLGLIEPGKYEDFPPTSHGEVITVTVGELIINGNTFKSGQTCRLPVGSPVVIEAVVKSAYENRYGN